MINNNYSQVFNKTYKWIIYCHRIRIYTYVYDRIVLNAREIGIEMNETDLKVIWYVNYKKYFKDLAFHSVFQIMLL